MKFKIGIIYGIIFVALVAAILIATGSHMGETNPGFARKLSKPIPVKVDEAKKVALEEILGTNGFIQPVTLIRLTSKISTDPVPTVETVAVDIGDMVEKGQLLIRFDNTLAQITVKTAESAKTTATSELRYAQKKLTHLKTVYKNGLQNAIEKRSRAVLENATGELERAELHLKRITVIFNQNLLPETELENAQAEVEKAKALFMIAEENRLLALKNLKNEVENAELELENARSRLKTIEEKLIIAEDNLAKTNLVSPASGIIMERNINAGESPLPRKELLTIGRIDHVLVEANFSEEKVGDIQLHQKALVTLSAFQNDLFEGEVVKIKPVTDPKTKSFLIYVKLANPEFKLKPGLSSFIQIQKTQSVLAIQNIALINPIGARESAVFLVDNSNKVTLKKVQTGTSAKGMTEILEGLSAGDRVVVVGQFHLKDGDQVRIGRKFDETD